MTPLLAAGPVSSASPEGPRMFWYFALTALACFVIWILVSEWKRKKAIQQFAKGKGLIYIGSCLPRSFPLSDTSVNRTVSVKNVVAGDRAGREFLFFDCVLGSGKGRRTQTVIAVRGTEECFGSARFGPFLMTESVGEWALVFRPKQTLPLDEIEALLADI